MELLTIATNVMALTLSLGNPDGGFYRTTNLNEHTVVIENYQEEDGLWEVKTKCTCSYDEANRIVSKEVAKWDNVSKKWIPRNCYFYTYDNDGFTVELSRWDSRKKEYQPIAKTAYHGEVGDYIVMTQYKWDKEKDIFSQIGNPLLMSPNNVFYAENQKP